MCQWNPPSFFFLCRQQDGDQEAVLATVVARVLRTVNIWEGSNDSTPSERSTANVSVELVTRPMLELCLHACWSTTPLLRRCQLDVVEAIIEDVSWRHFLSTSQSGSAAMDIMSVVLGLLDHQLTRRQECCRMLSLVSQILRISKTTCLRVRAHGRSVLPFSRREQPVDLEFSNMAARAFPRVLARADDESNDVRQSVMQTLGDLIPFIQPDGPRRQRLCSGVEQEENDIINIPRSVSSLEKDWLSSLCCPPLVVP